MRRAGPGLGVLALALALLFAGRASPEGLAARSLLASRDVRGVQLSPDGEWVIALVDNGRLHGLLAQRVGTQRVVPLLALDVPILAVAWVGRDRLLVDLGSRAPIFLGRISQQQDEVLLEREPIRLPGQLADPLPLDDESVLWSFPTENRSSIHRVALDDLTGEGSRRSVAGERVAQLPALAIRWIVDREGTPRAALAVRDEEYSVFVGGGLFGGFREVYRFEPETDGREVLPLGVSPDGTRLIVAAYAGHDTLGLHDFDMETGTVGAERFRRPDVDVTDALFDPIDGSLIAAVVEEGGESRFIYLDASSVDALDSLGERFPRERVQIMSRSADRRVQVLLVSGATNPGVYYLNDTATGSLQELGRIASHLAEDDLSPVETLAVESADGTRVEAFLALPRDLGPAGAPLVVMPHGGPIGVRDSKQFDAQVQYLASWGLATLQVNYRGSSGHGRQFQELGRKEWARGIEDDIDAAVEAAVARPGIDASRLCIMGGSYGGFSALASVLRHPDRYRCAVTIAGVTDVPLMFETSDFADSEQGREAFARIVGDPEVDREQLIAISPAYHVDRIQTPIYVIQGSEDRRVDPEHAERLALMLETFGKQYELLIVEGAGHGFDGSESIIEFRAVRQFLSKHLFPSLPFVEDPEWQDDSGIRLLPAVDR